MNDEVQPTAASHSRSTALLPLAALALVLPLAPPEIRGESAAGVALLIVLLALVGLGRARYRVPRLALILTLPAALPLVWLASSPGSVPQIVALFALAVALGQAAAELGDENLGRRLAWVMSAAACLVALHGLYQVGWGLDRLAATVGEQRWLPDHDSLMERLGEGRAFATFMTPAALGGYLVLCLPISVGLMMGTRGRARVIASLAALTQFAGLLATASATAGAALGGALLLGLLAWPRNRRQMAIGLGAALLMLGLVLVVRGPTLLSTADPDSPLRLRAGNLRAAAAMAGDHPWVGVGPGGFAENYPRYRRAGDNETRHVHNLPLELVAELGWFAGLALTLLFGVLFVRPLFARRVRQTPWRAGAALGLATFALHNLADFTAYMPSILWSASLLAGLLVSGLRDPAVDELRPVNRWLVGGAALATLLIAIVMAAGGVAREQRMAARHAAFAGEPAVARRLASRATRLAPWDPDAALFAARAVGFDDAGTMPREDDRRQQALELADRAVRRSPVNAAARVWRARVRLELGDFPGAYADMRQATRLYPRNEEYTRQLNGLAARIGEFAGQRESLR